MSAGKAPAVVSFSGISSFWVKRREMIGLMEKTKNSLIYKTKNSSLGYAFYDQ